MTMHDNAHSVALMFDPTAPQLAITGACLVACCVADLWVRVAPRMFPSPDTKGTAMSDLFSLSGPADSELLDLDPADYLTALDLADFDPYEDWSDADYDAFDAAELSGLMFDQYVDDFDHYSY